MPPAGNTAGLFDEAANITMRAWAGAQSGAVLLTPTTWFAEGFPLVKDPDVAYALGRAYKNWVADFCAAAPDRLFAAAMIPLQNMDFALKELERIAKLSCFPAVFIRPAFIESRYLNHPYYEPLWERLQDLGWGSRYPHQDTTSAWDAIASLREANVDDAAIVRILGGDAAGQFGVKLKQPVCD